jgi:hypothetical protein
MRLQLLGLALLACSEPRPASDGEPGAPFPHSADFATTHGEDAAQLYGCAACHPLVEATDTAGDTAGDTAADTGLAQSTDNAACRSCHPAYPHGEDFRDDHGASWLDDERPCTGCHGSAGTRDPTSSPSDTCVGCHASFPHPSNQASAREHGWAVVERGKPSACVSCHETSTCQDCHAAYPHTDDHIATHGDTSSEASCGGNCHDGAQGDAPGEISCDDCHGDAK